MPTTPNSRIGKVQFYISHLGPWAEHAGAIGLTQADITSLDTLTTAARAAHERMRAAREAAEAATHGFHHAVALMHGGPGAGSDMIETIKNFAQTTNDPGVYALAQIPTPGPRNAVPPPGTPTRFRVSLLGDGAVTLRWHCKNPAGTAGTVYEILRSTSGEPGGGKMEFVATVGAKSFTDTTIPAGTARVIYQLTALRSTLRGDPAEFNVNFGNADKAARHDQHKNGMGMAA